MALTEVGTPSSGNSESATDTSFAVTWPTVAGTPITPLAGDWAVVFGHLSGSALTMSLPAGWSAITGWTNPFTQGTASRAYAWAKQLSAGESPPAITNSGSVTGGWECHVFRDASGVRGSRQGASATSVALPTLTGCTAGSKLLTAVHARVASGTIPSGIDPDAAYAEAIDHATSRSTASANVRMQTATRDVAAAGDYGGETFTVANAITSSMAAGIVEVQPAGTAPAEVALTPATMALAAEPVTPVPQPVSVALTPAATAVAAVAVAAFPQPVTVSLTAAVVALSAVPASPVPAAVTVNLTAAALAATAVPVAPVPGPVAVNLTAATLVTTAVPLTPTLGPLTVNLAAAAFAVTAVAVTPVPAAATVALIPAELAVTAVALTPAPGAVTLVLIPAGLVVAAVPVVAVPGAGGVIHRPNTGTIARPADGAIARPDTGLVLRP